MNEKWSLTRPVTPEFLVNLYRDGLSPVLSVCPLVYSRSVSLCRTLSSFVSSSGLRPCHLPSQVKWGPNPFGGIFFPGTSPTGPLHTHDRSPPRLYPRFLPTLVQLHSISVSLDRSPEQTQNSVALPSQITVAPPSVTSKLRPPPTEVEDEIFPTGP